MLFSSVLEEAPPVEFKVSDVDFVMVMPAIVVATGFTKSMLAATFTVNAPPATVPTVTVPWRSPVSSVSVVEVLSYVESSLIVTVEPAASAFSVMLPATVAEPLTS